MADYNAELDILAEEGFAIKAPKGFKSDDWKSRSGRPGKVLYSRFSPDYLASDCYVTVSTVAKDPITDEIRKRIEAHIEDEGFSFEFEDINDHHFVFYSEEAEREYKVYHGFMILGDKKAILMDVVFQGAFDNGRQLAHDIMGSMHSNFNAEVTDEELAADAARLEAEDKADAEKKAAREAMKKAAENNLKTDTPQPAPAVQAEAPAQEQGTPVTVADMKEEEQNDAAPADTQASEPAADPRAAALDMAEEAVKEDTPSSPEDIAEDAESVEEIEEPEEVPAEPVFDDTPDGRNKSLIYTAIKTHDKVTLSEIQTGPELTDLGRMGITHLLNEMVKEGYVDRLEEDENIYFTLHGKAAEAPDSDAAPEAQSEPELDPEEQYKRDLEKYKEDMKVWKKSRDFFGKTDMPKPVKPVEPKKKK